MWKYELLDTRYKGFLKVTKKEAKKHLNAASYITLQTLLIIHISRNT